MLGLVAVSHPGRFAKITRLLSWLRVITFCGLWYGSICSGFLLLYCPLLPLLLLHQKLFRKITDIFFAAWEMYPAALLECLIGTRIIVTGDAILPHDRALIIMNHRTRLDWNFLWAAMFYACKPLAHRLKIVLKAPIRHIPGAGWVMQMNCFLYIYRRWERDKELISRALDYFRDIGHTCQILLFPEGTDLTPENKKRSHQYASKHHLDLYHQVLHPKSTGFVFLVQRMKQNEQLDAIYDITVGYPRTLPQSEVDIIKGKFPEEVHFQITRFPGNTIPDSEEQLKSWLADRWKQKEQILTRFYSSGSFQQPEKVAAENTVNGSIHPEFCDLDNPSEKVHKPNICTSANNVKASNFNLSPEKSLPLHKLEQIRSTTLYLALMFWTLLCFMALYGLFTSFFLQVWAVVHVTFFLFLSFITQGFHDLEISLYRLKERYLVSRLKLS